MTTLKDCQRSIALRKMQIVDTLMERVKTKSLLGISIITAIYDKQPISKVLQFIKESAQDNYNMVADVIGIDLLEEIINL